MPIVNFLPFKRLSWNPGSFVCAKSFDPCVVYFVMYAGHFQP